MYELEIIEINFTLSIEDFLDIGIFFPLPHVNCQTIIFLPIISPFVSTCASYAFSGYYIVLSPYEILPYLQNNMYVVR